jgi:diguanylate cyclase (GGDEF)-like protein
MNEAIASLKLVEAQAAALADERLSDPILQTSTPGSLGASMQAAVGRLTTSLTEREDFQRRLAHEASHDGLTRIPNRTAVLRHVTAALARTSRSSSTMALLFIDIDGFKAFNDAHGHHVGDTILRRTAQRLIGAVREGDLAGRLGGDEFVVVAESLDGIDGALVLSDRIIDVATQPILVEGVTINPSVSIGIALADGKGLTADELLRDADLAVYGRRSSAGVESRCVMRTCGGMSWSDPTSRVRLPTVSARTSSSSTSSRRWTLAPVP